MIELIKLIGRGMPSARDGTTRPDKRQNREQFTISYSMVYRLISIIRNHQLL